MKIKEGFVIREVAGTIVAVPTGELANEFHEMITLTEAAKFVWELLQKEDLNEEEITQRLIERYKIDRERAKADTQKFVENLKVAKVLA